MFFNFKEMLTGVPEIFVKDAKKINYTVVIVLKIM